MAWWNSVAQADKSALAHLLLLLCPVNPCNYYNLEQKPPLIFICQIHYMKMDFILFFYKYYPGGNI